MRLMNETKKNRNVQPRGEKTVNCPYCWAPNKVESEGNLKVENFELVTSHPPIHHCSNDFSEVKVPWWRFWAMKFPKRVMARRLKCKKCGLYFVVTLWPNDSSDSKEAVSHFCPILNWWTASKNLEVKYHLKLVKGETEKIERKIFLEDILDRFCDLLHIKKELYPLASFLFILIPFILFWILPTIALGGLSKLSHDYLLAVFFVLSFLMLTLLKRHCTVLRKALDIKKLPFLLSEQYRNSNLGKEAEVSAKGWLFGNPFQKITPPSFCGLIAVGFFLIWHINFIMNIASTFYETPYTGNPIFYTSYMTSIACAPFLAMIYFIVGNTIWIFGATTALIYLMTKHIPLRINPLKEMGGTEIFGKMVLSSLYPIAAIGAAIPGMVIWSTSTPVSYVLLVCILLVSIFMFIAAFGFFYSLWPSHNKLKERKEKEQNEILSKISLSAIIEEGMDFKDAVHTHLLLDTYNKISSMLEWPFKTDTLIKAFSAILVPFISLLINIIISFHKP